MSKPLSQCWEIVHTRVCTYIYIYLYISLFLCVYLLVTYYISRLPLPLQKLNDMCKPSIWADYIKEFRPHLCCCCPAQGNVCPCLHVTVRYEMGSSFTWPADTRRVRLSVPVARNPANELINARRLMCAHIKFGTTMMMMAIMRAATASSCSLGSRPTSLTAVNSLVYLKVESHFSFFLPPL